MAGEWCNLCLSEALEIIGGGTPNTRNPDYWGGDVPWLSVADFNTGYRWVARTEKTITRKGLEESSTTLLRPHDIIISARGTVGVVAQLSKPMAFNQSCYGLRAKSDVADTDFLYYALKNAVSDMKRIAHGGVFDTITRATFNSLRMDLPPLREQRAIAHILGTLDDKIELNRRMNETLEGIARAIFQSWFVDFDPVRAKADGRDPGLPQPIADLFPDAFEESELGEIPKGWQVETLGDLIELAYGKALKEENRQPGNIPVFGSNGQVGWHREKLVNGPGIIVGRKGNPGIVTWAPTDFFAIDTTFYVVPKAECRSLYFLFYALRDHGLAALGADSAVPGLNRNLAYMSQQVVPPPSILDTFDRFIAPLFQRNHHNVEQSRTLAALRDTLLPKLISGELRVPDAGQLMEMAI